MESGGFGFKLLRERQIDLTKADTRLYKWIVGRVPESSLCIGCGTCGSACIRADEMPVSVRRVLLMASRGLVDEAMALADHCRICGRCLMICPRNIPTRNVMHAVVSFSKANNHEI